MGKFFKKCLFFRNFKYLNLFNFRTHLVFLQSHCRNLNPRDDSFSFTLNHIKNKFAQNIYFFWMSKCLEFKGLNYPLRGVLRSYEAALQCNCSAAVVTIFRKNLWMSLIFKQSCNWVTDVLLPFFKSMWKLDVLKNLKLGVSKN